MSESTTTVTPRSTVGSLWHQIVSNSMIRERVRSVITSPVTGVSIFLAAMVLFFAYKTGGRDGTFVSAQNLQNMMLSNSWIAIAAFGQTLVIITAGIDLSVGSVMALSGLVAAYFLSGNESPWAVEQVVQGSTKMVVPDEYIVLGFALGCGVGALIGIINGVLIAWVNLPPFIATLGTMGIARGLCTGVVKGQTIRNLNDQFIEVGRGEYQALGYRFPYPSILTLVLTLIVGIFLARTIWGYRIYALGGNEQASKLSGINTHRTKLLVYTLSGLLGGLGGTLLTARLGSAAADTAKGYELQVIAAVVIGGTSLMGGKGTILGTLIGAAIMGVLRSGLNLIKVDAYWQDVAIGVMIIVAITFDQLRLYLQGRRLSDILRIDQWREFYRSRLGQPVPAGPEHGAADNPDDTA
jgi:ribose transport system permease protein